MVNEDDDKKKKEDSKKIRNELESRIGRTGSGHDWLRRVNQIGKNYSADFEDFRKGSYGEDETSSE